jgi:hypothetical protein
MILNPGCNAENRVYKACTADAYRTSAARFGLDRCVKVLPRACRSPGSAEWLQ